MVRNDDFFETFINSLRYASSNVSAILVGGLVFLLSAVVIGLPFFLGYITRCMREVVKGNGVLPEWVDIAGMFRDGVRMFAVFLAYALAYVIIVSIPAIPILVFNQLDMKLMVMLSTAVLIVTMAVVASIFCVVFFASWILYATEGSVRASVSPKKIKGLISRNPAGYFIALIASVAIMAVGSASSLLVIIIPWAGFIAFTALAFIYSKYYQTTVNTAGDGPGGLNERAAAIIHRLFP